MPAASNVSSTQELVEVAEQASTTLSAQATQIVLEAAQNQPIIFAQCTQIVLEVAQGIAVPTLAAFCPSSVAIIGQLFSGTLTAMGGTPPYTWAIIGGSLPPGLTLNPVTGVISGIPTTAGTYSYTVQVTDSMGLMASSPCAIVVGNSPCPPAFIPAGKGV